MKLYIENESEKNIYVYTDYGAINGIMAEWFSLYTSCNVPAGKKANVDLDITDQVLHDLDIETLKTISLYLRAYDSDTYETVIETETEEIETSFSDGVHDVVEMAKFDKEELYQNNGITIDFIGRESNSFFFTISNETGEFVYIDFDHLSINDYAMDAYSSDISGVVLNGSVGKYQIEVDSGIMERNSIDDIRKIEFSVDILPHWDYYQDYQIGPIVYEIHE